MGSPVAFVTGSGKRRVGAAVAEALARKGYALGLHYRSSRAEAETIAEELRRFSPRVEIYEADLAREGEVKTMIDRLFDDFGEVGVLVNSAAIWESKRLEEVTAEDVRRHFDTNALGTFLCCQQVGLRMVGQPSGGVIINLGDWAEVRPYLNYAAYFPSKGAVSAMTRTFAVELGTRNPKVRVNAILPGPVMLPAEMSRDEKEKVIASTLVKSEGSPDHVARAVAMFVENEFLTGVLLPVDGGRTIFAPE
jgi:pteridine reductase